MSTEAFIYDAIRTPRGRGKQTGSLHGTKPISLVVGLIDELRKRNPTADLDRLSAAGFRDRHSVLGANQDQQRRE